MWTFNGTAPGPVLRGRVGDVFEVTLVNDGTIDHGIDFHAGALAPDRPMRPIEPGERLVYRFSTLTARCLPPPANGFGSGCSTRGPAGPARFTWWAPSSTPPTGKAR